MLRSHKSDFIILGYLYPTFAARKWGIFIIYLIQLNLRTKLSVRATSSEARGEMLITELECHSSSDLHTYFIFQ